MSHTQVPIIRAIVALATELDLTVIAEGVETLDEIERLQQLNCHYAQGFAFGAAMTGAGTRQEAAGPARAARRALTTISVLAKSSPLKSSGTSSAFASAYEKQSPKLSWRRARCPCRIARCAVSRESAHAQRSPASTSDVSRNELVEPLVRGAAASTSDVLRTIEALEHASPPR